MSDYNDPSLFALVEQRKRWSSQRGWEMAYVYEGPSEAYDSWIATLPAGMISLELDTEVERINTSNEPHGWLRVTVVYALQGVDPPPPAQGEPPNQGRLSPPIWTVQMEESEIGLLEMDKVHQLRARDAGWPRRIATKCEIYIRAYARYLEGQTTSEPDYPTVSDTNPPDETNPQGPATQDELDIAAALIDRYIHDPDATQLVWAPVLEKQEHVVNNATLYASYNNVGKIYTWPQLLQETANAEGTSTDQCSLATAPLIDDATKSQLSTYYWLKTAPEVSPASGGTWQIFQRWRGYKSYDSFFYDAAIV